MEISFPSIPFESGRNKTFTLSPFLILSRILKMPSLASKNGKKDFPFFSFTTSNLKQVFLKGSPSLVVKCLCDRLTNFPVIDDDISNK